MEILLVGSDTAEAEQLQVFLRPVTAGISIATSTDTFKALYNQHTAAVIFLQGPLLEQLCFKNLYSPETTPGLLLFDIDQPLPDFVLSIPAIDIFPKLTTSKALIHKVKQLLHQYSTLQQSFLLQHKLYESEQSIQQHLIHLENLSERDGLTGMLNRRRFSVVFPQKFNTSLRLGTDITLLLIDIDNFSEINRVAGQDFGDHVINELSARITRLTLDTGTSFRFSGGSFCTLLSGYSKEEAEPLAEAILQECRDTPFISDSHKRTITVSIGMASRMYNNAVDHDELISSAEFALFTAKSRGRNRVVTDSSMQTILQQDSDSTFSSLKLTLQRMLAKTKRSTIAALRLFIHDILDVRNLEHVETTSIYANLLCKRLKMPENVMETFGNASAIHSTLKHLLHKEMLEKSGPLTPSERDILEQLPYKLTDLINQFDYFLHEKIVLQSYGEWYDGTGYPNGLKANEIPLAGRIFSLANALAAMKDDRPHRKRLTPDAIIRELVEGAGKQFDPNLVITLLEIIEERQLLDADHQLLQDARASLLNSTQNR